MKGAALNLKFSFEQISNACFIVVNISNEGLELYEMLKMELGRACRAMATTLKEAPEAGTRWMGQLIDAWSWHENRVVCRSNISTTVQANFVTSTRPRTYFAPFYIHWTAGLSAKILPS